MSASGKSDSGAPSAQSTNALTAAGAGYFTPRRLILQSIGFLIGAALLAWCIRGAALGADWSRFSNAPPLAIGGMLLCSVLSLAINGAIFHVASPVAAALRPLDIQRVNAAGQLLNYAPVRIGALARIVWHRVIDGVSLAQIAAWFVAIGVFLAFVLGALVTATLIVPDGRGAWGAIVVALLLVGGALLVALASRGTLKRFSLGLNRTLGNPRVVALSLTLRLLDVAAFVGRLAFGSAILKLSFDAGDLVILGVAALASSLIPLGRVGFREFIVAQVAMTLAVDAEELGGHLNQLALIDSAAEAAVVIPVGGASFVWMMRRWRRNSAVRRKAPAPPPNEQRGSTPEEPCR